MRGRTIWIVAAMACLATAVQSAPPAYVITSVVITDLGTLGGNESVARDINNAGEIVGWSRTATGAKHAFLYRAGGMIDIAPSTTRDSEANGINYRTEVVGTRWLASGPASESQGFHWTGGALVGLNHIIDPGVAEHCLYRSAATAINDSGHITGSVGLARDLRPDDAVECLLLSHPALWTTPLIAPAVLYDEVQPGIGNDINATTVIVGHTKSTAREAFRWNAGAMFDVPPPLSTDADVFYPIGAAYGINNAGRVVGQYTRVHLVAGGQVSTTRAFLWNGLAANSTDLGPLPTGSNSVAREINEQGFVTGYGDKVTVSPVPGPALFFGNAAFLWHSAFGMQVLPRLPTSGPSGACEAYALNDRNSQSGVIRIVGYCTSAGKRRAVRWDVTIAS
jgi:probable HAF family extracellular repeat protein